MWSLLISHGLGVLFPQGEDESLCPPLGFFWSHPGWGFGVPHYRLLRIEVCTSDLVSAHMSQGRAAVSSGVLGCSGVAIVYKFPVFLGCIFPRPVIRESWFLGGLLKICGCWDFRVAGFSCTKISWGIYKTQKRKTCCSSGPKVPNWSGFSLPFRILCLPYIGCLGAFIVLSGMDLSKSLSWVNFSIWHEVRLEEFLFPTLLPPAWACICSVAARWKGYPFFIEFLWYFYQKSIDRCCFISGKNSGIIVWNVSSVTLFYFGFSDVPII